MDWLPLIPLTIKGKKASVINRRIATHLKLRADIDAGKGTKRFPSHDAATREALRRELFIRRDIGTLLTVKNMDTVDALAAFKAVHDSLKVYDDMETGGSQ